LRRNERRVGGEKRDDPGDFGTLSLKDHWLVVSNSGDLKKELSGKGSAPLIWKFFQRGRILFPKFPQIQLHKTGMVLVSRSFKSIRAEGRK
jgi:hypothetical protein